MPSQGHSFTWSSARPLPGAPAKPEAEDHVAAVAARAAEGVGGAGEGPAGEGAADEGATGEGAAGEGATGEGATGEGAAGEDVATAQRQWWNQPDVNPEGLAALETHFLAERFPGLESRKQLAGELKVTQCMIQAWFQHRRTQEDGAAAATEAGAGAGATVEGVANEDGADEGEGADGEVVDGEGADGEGASGLDPADLLRRLRRAIIFVREGNPRLQLKDISDKVGLGRAGAEALRRFILRETATMSAEKLAAFDRWARDQSAPPPQTQACGAAPSDFWLNLQLHAGAALCGVEPARLADWSSLLQLGELNKNCLNKVACASLSPYLATRPHLRPWPTTPMLSHR